MNQSTRTQLGSIEHSLEAVTERVGDPSDLVYARLYLKAPDMQFLFARDANRSVRNEMFQQVIEAVLDLCGENRYAEQQIANEWTNHQGLGVPPEQFRLIFVAMIEIFEEILQTDWSLEFKEAWAQLLKQVDAIIAKTANHT